MKPLSDFASNIDLYIKENTTTLIILGIGIILGMFFEWAVWVVIIVYFLFKLVVKVDGRINDGKKRKKEKEKKDKPQNQL